MKRTRCILHADMDAFFAAVEQRDRPELRGRPVVVGGASDRGVVSAASYEARRYGIHSAMPTALARRLCPHASFVSGDMPRYRRESKRIFEIFREFTPSVEGLSLDEAFLDLTGTERLMGAPIQLADRLRARVRSETSLVVSVGIAPVKMVAKIASAAAKPDGVLEVSPGRVREFLDPLPIRCLWGVGPVAEDRLGKAGIRTIGDLAAASDARLDSLVGDWGRRVAELARGRDLREVEPLRSARSYSEENTFGSDVCDPDRLDAALQSHAEAVASRLRHDGVRARTVVLKLRLGRRRKSGPRGYPLLTRRKTLAEASDDGGVFAREARRLLRRLKLEEPVRLLGIAAAGIESREHSQLPLFGPSEEAQRRRRLNGAIDQIAARFGAHALRRGSLRGEQRAGLSLQVKRGEAPDP